MFSSKDSLRLDSKEYQVSCHAENLEDCYTPAYRLFERKSFLLYMDLRSGRPLGYGLGKLGGKGFILLGVDESLTPGDLELSVPNERAGIDSFVCESNTVDIGAYVCCLRHGFMLSSETTKRFL